MLRRFRRRLVTMWASKWTKNSDEMAKLLGHWRGARAEAWEYSHGHGQLLIRFFREGPHAGRSMYLLCRDCRSVHFHNSWPDMDVRVDWTSGSDVSSHTVSDGTRLRVECGAVLALESDTFICLRDNEPTRPPSLLVRQS
jgi:hypothetical protein